MSKRKIAGAAALVTGASSGIGRETALELVRQGARVLVTARREDRLVALVEEIADLGGEAHRVVGDISDADVREKLLDSVQSHFGSLDILINNAGVGAIGPFAEADEQRLRRVMEVNFFSPVELTRAALPLLQAGNRPIVVNVSSVLGHRAVPNKSEYCASKFALHGWSDALRAELSSQGVDVLVANPSTTRSEFFENVLEDKVDLPWRSLGSMSSRSVARKMLRAIARGKHEIILSPGGKLLVWLDRLMPSFTDYLVSRFG